ncbi:MAG: hypothetical protein WC243_03745 [Patescibacteria group bacterium]|jgi:hypothetical protein
MLDKYTQAVLKIIKEQESLIGPLALDLAKKSENIVFSNGAQVTINGNPIIALGDLVGQYNTLFGRTSVEVSKLAIKKSGESFTQEELPEILK